jgi:hypothetical protein
MRQQVCPKHSQVAPFGAAAAVEFVDALEYDRTGILSPLSIEGPEIGEDKLDRLCDLAP